MNHELELFDVFVIDLVLALFGPHHLVESLQLILHARPLLIYLVDVPRVLDDFRVFFLDDLVRLFQLLFGYLDIHLEAAYDVQLLLIRIEQSLDLLRLLIDDVLLHRLSLLELVHLLVEQLNIRLILLHGHFIFAILDN